MRVAIVKAAHDDEAGVWYVEHSDVEGLHVEGESFETFCDNVASAVEDLLEGEGGEFTLKSLRTPRCAPASPREVSNRLLRRRFTI
jgi:predicted RNase H-like HicB family nuclease